MENVLNSHYGQIENGHTYCSKIKIDNKYGPSAKKFKSIREGLKKIKNGWIYPFGLAGWGQHGAKIQPKKKLFLKKIQR